jgi:hypothetical protein
MKALMLFPMGLAATLATATPLRSAHEGVVQGALKASLAGQAVFGPVVGAQTCGSNGCSASFSLELGAYSDNGAVVFSRVSSERPRVGTYKVVAFGPGTESPGQFHAMISLGSVAAPLGAFRAVSGSVTIVQSTEARIVGRYEVKAIGFLAADPDNEDREITVRGGFTAEPAARASSFEAAAHGAVEAAPQGSAEFGTMTNGGASVFALNLGAYSEQGAIVLSREGGAQPGVGVYRVSQDWSGTPGDFHGLVVTGSPARPTGVFHARSGSVTITSSTADRITGAFELHGVGFLASTPENEDRELVVTGAFSAAPGGNTLTLTVR